MLKVQDFKVKVSDKEILHGVNLEIGAGEIHALMGQNGSGKSTLAQSLMGHPNYTVISGTGLINDKNILEMDPTQRASAGLFLSFQYPSEITGVNVSSYLRMIYNKKQSTPLSPVKFREILKEKLNVLEMKPEFLQRYLNEGFSGGEKKRMEMLQMLILEPKLVILDEVDSGLDIDAVKVVSKAVNYLYEKTGASVLIITHYPRILEYVKPQKVHIMKEGLIVKTGGMELAHDLEASGYATL